MANGKLPKANLEHDDAIHLKLVGTGLSGIQTTEKANITLEILPCSKDNTSPNGGCSIAIIVFRACNINAS